MSRHLRLLGVLEAAEVDLMPHEVNNMVFILESLGIDLGYDLSLFSTPSMLGVESPEVAHDLWLLYKMGYLESLSPVRIRCHDSIPIEPGIKSIIGKLIEMRSEMPRIAVYLYLASRGEDVRVVLERAYGMSELDVNILTSALARLSAIAHSVPGTLTSHGDARHRR